MSGWKEVKHKDMTMIRHSTSNTIEVHYYIQDLDGTKESAIMYLDDCDLKNINECLKNINELDSSYLK